MVNREEGQWYSNKELYEMMVDLSKGLERTNAELARTQVLIRDYNGLREEVGECRREILEIKSEKKGSKEMWGYAAGGIGLLLALITAYTR